MELEESIQQSVGLIKTPTKNKIPAYTIESSIKLLEKNYEELKKDINGRYYSGCCV